MGANDARCGPPPAGVIAAAMPKKLLLVDASNQAYRAYHAIQTDMRAPDGFPTRALFGFARMLLALVREREPDYVAVVFDKGKSFRNDIYPEYKGQRPDMPDDLRRQWAELAPLAQSLGFYVVAEPGTEADDIIGTLARRFASDDVHVGIVSGDKDFCQLVDERIHVLDLMKGAEIDPAGVVERWGVRPDQVVDLLSLMGDSSDNVPGIPGVGEKKAALFMQKYGSLEGVLANHAAIGGKTGAVVAESADVVARARLLITIRTDMPHACELDDLRRRPLQVDDLRERLTRYNFKAMLKELDLHAATPAAEGGAVHSSAPQTVWGPGPLAELVTAFRRAGRVVVATELADEKTLRRLRFAWRAPEGLMGAVVPVDRRALEALRPLLADSSVGKLMFNAKEELNRLAAAGVEVAGLAGDPVIADFLLDADRKHGLSELTERFAEGVKLDNDREAQLILHILEGEEKEIETTGVGRVYREIELPLVPVLAGMERLGIAVDLPALQVLAQDLDVRVAEHVHTLHELAGENFNVNSTQQLAQILYEKLGLKGAKKTKFGYSTDADTLEKLDHPLATAVLAYRELAKLKSTYVDTLPSAISPEDGRIHTTFAQTVAATGRLSSNNPNLQNIPVRTEEGRRIRHCFVSPAGSQFVSADYSQVELRVLAHYCGEGALVESFRNQEDIHRRTASEIFHVHPSLVTPEMRRAAKAINFGIVYGMGAFRLANDLRISRGEAQAYIDGYFARYPQVRAYMDQAIHAAREHGYATTLYGRRRQVVGITASNPNDRAAAERIAINTPIQGTAADLIKLAMIQVAAELSASGLRARLVLQVHDELLFEVPDEEVAELRGRVKGLMEGVAQLAVPLVVDTGASKTWGGAH